MIFVEEKIFPFNFTIIYQVLVRVVETVGKYDTTFGGTNKATPFHNAIGMKGNWYLQQLIKVYAGELLGIKVGCM